ncbi:RDD family protein [Dictyobacter formicarum]|uniref:RDD domain-containing protein n=1 Tax=Dictyobacter formicarum TaxID=2778368 RepID=A0ABQ3VC00_9CHLR|nr:RDD family protein [Dictyobacter formicarum]GHO83682.1 hypothetical protein KSZ_16880 [Dictyobacter formicarum]
MQAPYAEQANTPAYAGVGIRFLAVLIDAIILGIVGSIITMLLSRQAAIAGILEALIFFLYFIIMEATSGATLGKKALGLRVVREDGAPISWTESIIRNLLRIIDGLFAYLVGAIFIWTSP